MNRLCEVLRRCSPVDGLVLGNHLNAKETHKEVSYYSFMSKCRSKGLERSQCESSKVLTGRMSGRFYSHLRCVLCKLVLLTLLSCLGQEASVFLTDVRVLSQLVWGPWFEGSGASAVLCVLRSVSLLFSEPPGMIKMLLNSKLQFQV